MHVKNQAGGKGKENFPALGDGEVDFTKVFDIVKKSALKGPFTVEMRIVAKALHNAMMTSNGATIT